MSNDPPVAVFFKKSSLASKRRNVITKRESSSEESDEETVVKVRRSNKMGLSTKSERLMTDSISTSVSYTADLTSRREGPSDMGATAILEYETAERQENEAKELTDKQINNDLQDQSDKIYHGKSSSNQFIEKRESILGKAAQKGPTRAASNIRSSIRWDYQPNICKDYKETGVCGFGDSCIFLHDRTDYKTGWQLEKAFDEAQKEGREWKPEDALNRLHRYPKKTENNNKEEDLPFKCYICRNSFSDPIVTKCKHYFCEACALRQYKKSHRCFICDEPTEGVFNPATLLLAKLGRQNCLKNADSDVSSGDDQATGSKSKPQIIIKKREINVAAGAREDNSTSDDTSDDSSNSGHSISSD